MNDTYESVITKWTVATVKAIKAEAIRLCSGPLLKVQSGTLINSFFTRVWDRGHQGLVGNRAPHAAMWEFKGLKPGIQKAPKDHPFKIIKRGVYSPRSSKGVVYRQTIKVSGKYARPVAPLWTATRNEVLGPNGQRRREELGYGIGWVVVTRWLRMLQQRGYTLSIRVQ